MTRSFPAFSNANTRAFSVALLVMLSCTGLAACASMPNSTKPMVNAAPTSAVIPALPTGSRLVNVNGHRLHVRSLGREHTGPAVVLLSGPTDNWHADSGWFALLQPLLAKQYRVHAIDRTGLGFSDIVPDSSYESFAADLLTLLPRLEKEPVVVVAFASSNLALHHYFAKDDNSAQSQGRIRSVLLIDPDALHPDLISFYAEQAVPFQRPDKLADYVNAGKYDARAEDFYKEERAHLSKILPPSVAAEMDWPFYDAIAKQRQDRARILARFAETARYDRDVLGAAKTPWPSSVPVWSYDTDFETTAIEAVTDPEAIKAGERAKLEAWHRLGTEWMQDLPGHCRIGSTSREHLATVAEADRLVRLVDRLMRSPDCPAETR